jgi:regulator of RNase E activity RraA
VADCLDKAGALPGVVPVNPGHFRVGRVCWACAWKESNWDVHAEIRNSRDGDIMMVEAIECGDRALFGDLVSKYLLLYRQASAIVACGKLRDVPRLVKENWPIWYQGPNPIGCFNAKPSESLPPDVLARQRGRYHDAIAVCDDSGVVIIPKEKHTPEFLAKLDRIEELEDIWYECVDHRKWSTFDTVCLKKYQKDEA